MIQTTKSVNADGLNDPAAYEGRGSAETGGPCFHCGTICVPPALVREDKAFCCQGCRTVFELLTENGLAEFYNLADAGGIRVKSLSAADQFRYLDDPVISQRLVDFSDGKLTRVTFHIPAIHCIACVWLLENLFQLKPGIGQSQVNFPRKEVALSFDPGRVKLSEVVALLASLGYEPELKLTSLEARPVCRARRRLWIQLGVAGFAFGNIMLFSISSYFGLDEFTGPGFRRLTGWISLVLSLPVLIYSAAGYWRAAWTSLRQKTLNIDVPIAIGIAALFLQSCAEVLFRQGEGYFDTLAGLIFFLLCGKMFQQKTYDRLAFDLDYKAFFPLSVRRKTAQGEEQTSLAQLAVGDRLIIRNGELIPADARLVAGAALIDYSFVTGESEPVEKQAGEHLYAGGRQMGGAIELEMFKAVSQSYLTSLWNQDAFRKDRDGGWNAITNTYSRYFTVIVIAIAAGAAGYWALSNPALALKSFTSVLIVACPCALALASPFALGTAQRFLARRNVFLKNPFVLEAMAKVDAVVFDKTGTLTAAGAGGVMWQGAELNEREERWLFSMARHSTHPLALRIGEAVARQHFPEPVRSFLETAGCGMEGSVAGHEIWMGTAAWLSRRNAVCSDTGAPAVGTPEIRPAGSHVHVAIDGRHRGCFVLTHAVRPEAERLFAQLPPHLEVVLLSGDNAGERSRFEGLLGARAELYFNQSPLDKLNYIGKRQAAAKTLMMVGDGLNDAGALKQSDVGVAVVESVGAFSPASDVIMSAEMVTRLGEVLRYARQAVRVVYWSIGFSTLYNVIGVVVAASGRLSPVVCAVLMPISSVTVVAFACGMATWLGRRTFKTGAGR